MDTFYTNCLEEVEALLVEHSLPILQEVKDKKQAYHGSRLFHLGLSVPMGKALLKRGYSFSAQTPSSQFAIWDFIWRHSTYFEGMSQALYFCIGVSREPHFPEFWPQLAEWSERLDNWAHSDGLSLLYNRLLFFKEKEVYSVLQEWNHSPNPWLRRQSIVSLLYYASAKKPALSAPKIIPLAENLLLDQDIYVQKGLGWCLREFGKIYPEEAKQFLNLHIRKLSSIAFSTATEKAEPILKQRLKEMRKS